MLTCPSPTPQSAGWLPPDDATPTLTKATLINASDASSASTADGFAWAFVDLTFDANKTSVTFPIELMWRLDSTGKVPVVLTQWSE